MKKHHGVKRSRCLFFCGNPKNCLPCVLLVLLLKNPLVSRPVFSSIRASVYSAAGKRALWLPIEVGTFSALGCVQGSFHFSLPPSSFIWNLCFCLSVMASVTHSRSARRFCFFVRFCYARSYCPCLSLFPSTPRIVARKNAFYPFACMAPVSGVSVNSKKKIL